LRGWRAVSSSSLELRCCSPHYADIGRRTAQRRLQSQLERLKLLQQITHAIGERQDLASIFQVLIRTLEDQLPVDFGCVCRYDSVGNLLTVMSVGAGSRELAMELAMGEQARIDIDENGLSRCVRGQLVYEPDLDQTHFPFPERLARGGLRSLVIAPLLTESKVFGILVVARRELHSFSSGDCEFLQQLSEHTALAANAAPASGWRWCIGWCSAMAPPSKSTANWVKEPRFVFVSLSPHPRPLTRRGPRAGNRFYYTCAS